MLKSIQEEKLQYIYYPKFRKMDNSKTNGKKEQISLVEDKLRKIEILKNKNDILENYINKKSNIFAQKQQPTFDFLRKMQ